MAESMTDEELMAALEQSPVSQMSDEELLSALGGQTIDSAVPAPIAEFASGVNRGITEGIDFFTTDAINAAANLAGSDFRVPRLTDIAQSQGVGVEGFMEPGLARDIVGTAGEFAPAVVGVTSQATGIPGAVERVFARGIKGLESGSPQARAIAERLNTSPRINETVAGIRRGDAPQAGQRLTDTGEIVKDKALTKAASQGFDEGVLASIRAGSVQDKRKMREILTMRERGMRNKRFGMLDRASDVVGRSIKKRIDTVVDANKKAGEAISREARKLSGKKLDFSDPINQFYDDLASEGVSFGDEGLEFFDSRFEDLAPSERLLKTIFKRTERLLDSGDARKAHELKQFIDEQVTYGKSEGLAGKAESLVKRLRSSVDGLLDDSFDAYRQANDDYAATIGVIDDLQSAAGRKINISGENADKALGTLSRTIMSNNRGRIELVNSLDELERVANRFGGVYDDDILLQALFVDELDTVFKPQARTSLAGDVAKSAADVGADVATGGGTGGTIRQGFKFVGDKLTGRNEENALKAIREFLEQ